MKLLRVYVVVLIAGWLIWLGLDKSPPSSRGPGSGVVAPGGHIPSPMVLPPPGRPVPGRPAPEPPLVPGEGDMLADFQYAVDMVKRGAFQQGFVVLWRRQYLWVSAVITALVVLVLVPAVRAVMPGLGGVFRSGRRRAGGAQRSRDEGS